MKVLLIEDDCAMAKSIAMMLQGDGFTLSATGLGEAGLELARVHEYDIIILDLDLPDLNGYEVLRRLRGAHIGTPVLILSGLCEPSDKVRGLGLGADDYLTKPFDKRELAARLQAIHRRAADHAEAVVTTGKMAVNLDAHAVEIDGQSVHLTGKEYAMLELLSLRKGSTLSKAMFLDHLYGGRDEPELKIIDVFICKLRKKLSDASGGENYIETVWGRGYALLDPMDEAAAA